MNMARMVKDDFEGLICFVKSYSLSAIESDCDFLDFVSTLHKKFYSYLILIEELRLCVDDTKKKPVIGKEQFEFLQESVSDCGQCLFLAINGCYKGARLLLRSSIENFLKGVCMDEVTQIITEKSVYQVFDDAGTAKVFQNNTFKDDMHSIYGELCMDVHTADSSHMAGVSALKFFPHFVKDEAEKLSSKYIKLIPVFVTTLCLKYNNQFHSIDYKNKEVISSILLDEMRAKVYGG